MNSNFRLYYFKNKWFYLHVLETEEPGERGFQFKVTVHNVSEGEVKEQEKELFLALSDLQAENVRVNTREKDRMKAFCNVKDRENARTLFMELPKMLSPPLRAVVFLDFPEEVFVKHGDLAAEQYYKDLAEY